MKKNNPYIACSVRQGFGGGVFKDGFILKKDTPPSVVEKLREEYPNHILEVEKDYYPPQEPDCWVDPYSPDDWVDRCEDALIQDPSLPSSIY